jgi:hypothetical protein
MDVSLMYLSQQNENVRLVQSRNVRFHPGRKAFTGPADALKAMAVGVKE